MYYFRVLQKLPKAINDDDEELTFITLTVLIDEKTGEIMNADCTLSSRLAEQFLISMIVGRSIYTNCEEIVQCIKKQ